MDLTIKQLQQSVAQNELNYHRDKNENNSILKSHEDQITELVEDVNELTNDLNRLDLDMGAYKDLADRLGKLENAPKVESKSLWDKIWKRQ